MASSFPLSDSGRSAAQGATLARASGQVPDDMAMIRAAPTMFRATTAVLALACAMLCASARAAEPVIRPALDGVFAAFETHPLVGLGDVHDLARLHDASPPHDSAPHDAAANRAAPDPVVPDRRAYSPPTHPICSQI